MRFPILTLTFALAAAMLAAPAMAQSGQQLPEWDQLTADQREALVSTVRDRWNDAPERRERMLRHAERWQQMTAEERKSAHHGMKRWRDMSPERREEARALYQRMRDMPAAASRPSSRAPPARAATRARPAPTRAPCSNVWSARTRTTWA